MSKLLSVMFLAFALYAAEDAWSKVEALKSGTEIRVYKKGAAQPVTAKFGDAREDALIMVVKNAEVAVPKDQIDRIDFRPTTKRAHVESRTTTEDPTKAKEPPAGMNGHPEGGSSSSTTVSMGSKPDFETIYRRPAGKK